MTANVTAHGFIYYQTIVVFTTEGCPRCEQIKAELVKEDFVFTVEDSKVLITPIEGWREKNHYKALARLHYTDMELPILLIDDEAYSFDEAVKRLGLDITEDTETKAKILKALEDNKIKHGERYCPCVNVMAMPTTKRTDYICPCKPYRDTKKCICGLYGATDDEI